MTRDQVFVESYGQPTAVYAYRRFTAKDLIALVNDVSAEGYAKYGLRIWLDPAIGEMAAWSAWSGIHRSVAAELGFGRAGHGITLRVRDGIPLVRADELGDAEILLATRVGQGLAALGARIVEDEYDPAWMTDEERECWRGTVADGPEIPGM
jgi:hypothetical protein